MKYAQISPFEICNGKGIGISLYVQGCHFHCKGCFNSEAWDFDGGKEWTSEIKGTFLKLIMNPHIKRVTILGGEPLADENVEDVLNILIEIRELFKNEKKIWLYTGYTWDSIFYPIVTDDFDFERDQAIDRRKQIAEMCDVVVDGRYMEELKDLTLKFVGSSNQRLIDVKESLNENQVVLYN